MPQFWPWRTNLYFIYKSN